MDNYLVDIFRVATVMYTMVRWRVDDVLKRSELVDHLGMDPEHVQFAELKVRQEDRRWNARQSERHVGELSAWRKLD